MFPASFRIIKFLFLFACIFSTTLFAQVPWASGLSKGEDLRIKLVTFGYGDDIPSWWGHTAIIVEDLNQKKARIYNFGLFSFELGWMLEFAMGRLVFSAGDFDVPRYFAFYKRRDRDIRVLTLNISPHKRLQMAKALAINVLPENRDYLYDHYYDNCSTRLRDIIDKAVDGQMAKATKIPGRMTLREHTRRYIGHNLFMEMLIMYLMNNSIDRPISQWDEMFLPDELERRVSELEYLDARGSRQKLATDYYIYYQADRQPVPSKAPVHWPGALLTGIILGMLAISLALWQLNSISQWPGIIFGMYHVLFGLVVGVPGLALTLIASFTEHTLTYYNENLLLSNPITFLILILGISLTLNKKWAIRWLNYTWCIHILGIIAAIILKMFPAFDQDNWLVIALLLPVYLGFAVAIRLILSGKNWA